MQFEVLGGQEMDRTLAELPKAVGRQVLRGAARKSLQPVAAAAKGLAPVGQGGGASGKALARSIRIATKVKASQQRFSQILGASVQMYVGATAPHAHLIEFGTAPRRQKSTGRYTGQVSPQPFMRPAWDQHEDKIKRELPATLWREIYKAARRVRRMSERLASRLPRR